MERSETSKNQQHEADIRKVQRSLYGLMNTIASDNPSGDKDDCLDDIRGAIDELGRATERRGRWGRGRIGARGGQRARR